MFEICVQNIPKNFDTNDLYLIIKDICKKKNREKEDVVFDVEIKGCFGFIRFKDSKLRDECLKEGQVVYLPFLFFY
jgi:hypothetical protein